LADFFSVLLSRVFTFKRLDKADRDEIKKAFIKKKAAHRNTIMINTCTPEGKVTNRLSSLLSLKITERSEAKRAKRRFSSKIKTRNILAQPFLARIKRIINWSFYPLGLKKTSSIKSKPLNFPRKASGASTV
jgi:hypothetical protein